MAVSYVGRKEHQPTRGRNHVWTFYSRKRDDKNLHRVPIYRNLTNIRNKNDPPLPSDVAFFFGSSLYLSYGTFLENVDFPVIVPYICHIRISLFLTDSTSFLLFVCREWSLRIKCLYKKSSF